MSGIPTSCDSTSMQPRARHPGYPRHVKSHVPTATPNLLFLPTHPHFTPNCTLDPCGRLLQPTDWLLRLLLLPRSRARAHFVRSGWHLRPCRFTFGSLACVATTSPTSTCPLSLFRDCPSTLLPAAISKLVSRLLTSNPRDCETSSLLSVPARHQISSPSPHSPPTPLLDTGQAAWLA